MGCKKKKVEYTPKQFKFKSMTIEEIQGLRDEYAEKISELVSEFEEKTDLTVDGIDLDYLGSTVLVIHSVI